MTSNHDDDQQKPKDDDQFQNPLPITPTQNSGVTSNERARDRLMDEPSQNCGIARETAAPSRQLDCAKPSQLNSIGSSNFDRQLAFQGI